MQAQLRRAERRDLPAVETLLKQADLPPRDPQVALSNVIVAVDDRALVGAVLMEVFGRSGLLRGVVVAPERRGQGLGRELFRSLLARAHELSLRDLYVRADGAREFLTKLGFEPLGDEELPGSIRGSRPLRGADEVLRLRLG